MISLRTNGLIPPTGFPAAPYEAIHGILEAKYGGHPAYIQHAGAWNALAYRFREATDSGDMFKTLLSAHGASPAPEERYEQERALFDFFSSGFAVFESTCYGLFAIGNILDATSFPLATERDQQRVTPGKTHDAYKKAFAGDPVIAVMDRFFSDPAYQRVREVRNVLTHRTAPGRRMFVSLGDDDIPPVEWKLNNMPLDQSIVDVGLAELSRLMTLLLDAAATFANARL